MDVVRRSVLAGGMVPLIVAPTGGTLTGEGADPVTVQRTFATARSVEFDALLVAGTPGPAVDAQGGRDAKAGVPALAAAPVDPRIVLMLQEAYRHAKPLGGWDDPGPALQAAGIATDALGVVTGSDGEAVLREVTALLGAHRVWDRFPAPAENGVV